MTERMGFIGLGTMGRPMALNLLKARFPLTVWNRTPGKGADVVAAGARAGRSPRDVAAASDVVITMVSDTPDVEEVLLGPEGVIRAAYPGLVVIDMGTTSPQATRALALKLRQAGVDMLDAPVSGGATGAAQATLTIMVGGEERVFRRCLPIFQALGQRVTLCGGHGAGQTVKLVNQIMVVGNLLAMSEAFLFATAAGVDLQKAFEAVSPGAAGSWVLANRGPLMLRRDGGRLYGPAAVQGRAPGHGGGEPPEPAPAGPGPRRPALRLPGRHRPGRRRQPRPGEGARAPGRPGGGNGRRLTPGRCRLLAQD